MGFGTRPTLGANLSKYSTVLSVQHLGGGDVPDGYEEMVCDSCMASHDFLKPYKLHPPVKVGGGGEGQEVDVTSSGDSSCATHKLSTEESKLEKKSHPLQPKKTDMESSSGGSREQQSAGPTDSTAVSTSATADQPSGSGGVCELDRRRRLLLGVSGSSEEGAGYFSATWRSQLCRCHQCMVSRRTLASFPRHLRRISNSWGIRLLLSKISHYLPLPLCAVSVLEYRVPVPPGAV